MLNISILASVSFEFWVILAIILWLAFTLTVLIFLAKEHFKKPNADTTQPHRSVKTKKVIGLNKTDEVLLIIVAIVGGTLALLKIFGVLRVG